MKCVDDFRLKLGQHELVPIIVGGMGVDISTVSLALETARLGGIGHISDAMVPTVSDRRFNTKYVKNKLQQYKLNVANTDKSAVKFDLGLLAEATALHVRHAMDAKKGNGLIFVNCMEKLTMNALEVEDIEQVGAKITGPLGTFALVEDHPRFRDVKLGIIVSSLRALQLFLKKVARTNRLPDYIIVEGPLAGGHLGFGMDWAKYDLATIFTEIRDWLAAEQLNIPLIPAGGIFTGSDATAFMNMISPTGYPMRMLKGSPAIGDGIRPNCEAYGYLLDSSGNCQYIEAYNREVAAHPDAKKIRVWDKTCLCTQMRNFDCWTCGQYTYRLKDTSRRNADGSYQLLTAEHVFHDYQFSTDGKIALPA
jgi:nitronate monooxygenase